MAKHVSRVFHIEVVAHILKLYNPRLRGPFRILAVIGEGAMGIVYEAEQERPRRRVALKIIRPGVATPAMLRRFEHEYEFLGRLQHPGIAQIYQAGVAETGYGPQPYFAMELVRGRRLDDYVRLKELGLEDRLALVADIADAVQHAHHRGVIHRDLKPANILVTESGGPKVLDFGLARAAQAELQSTVQTMAGEVVGTMSYMSPEQVVGDMSELDTRSDVYALGVILYELLSGRLPFDLSRKSLPEAVRIIRDEEPARLSSITARLAGRRRDHRGEGAREGQAAPLRIGSRPRRRHPPVPARRADRGPASERVVSDPQVRAPPQGTGRRRGRRDHRAGRRRRGQHVAGGSRVPGRARRAGARERRPGGKGEGRGGHEVPDGDARRRRTRRGRRAAR